MKRRTAPDLDSLMEMYTYDPRTGLFRFAKDVGTRGRRGCVAGATRVDGYIGIALDGKIYLAHHLAWYYHYNAWPPRLDHIDRNKAHNAISNLRIATAPENGVNNVGWASHKRKNRLPKGVYLDQTKTTKFMAAIRINRRLKILGYFDLVQEAESAYRIASLKYHGQFSPFYDAADGTT